MINFQNHASMADFMNNLESSKGKTPMQTPSYLQKSQNDTFVKTTAASGVQSNISVNNTPAPTVSAQTAQSPADVQTTNVQYTLNSNPASQENVQTAPQAEQAVQENAQPTQKAVSEIQDNAQPAQKPVSQIQDNVQTTETLPKQEALNTKLKNNDLDQPQQALAPVVDTTDMQTSLRKAKRKNGVIEKVYDTAKNLTGLGMGSKKVQKVINEAAQGTKTEEDVKNAVSKYRVSQENAAQTVGDLASVGAASGLYFGLKKKLVLADSIININTEELIKLADESKIGQGLQKFIKNKDKTFIALAVLAAITGAAVKAVTMKLNRIGSDRYKLDKKDELTKQQKRDTRAALKADKKNANFRNRVTGFINGATLPIITALGPIAGIPAYIGINLLSKYFIGSKNDEEHKSVKGFANSIKDNALFNAAGVALMAVPLAKKGKFQTVLETNARKVTEKLKNAKLEELEESTSAFKELNQILNRDPEIRKIMHGSRMSNEDKITQLTDKNIFAIKFKQIDQEGGFFSFTDGLTKALRESCPPTHTMDEAQSVISGVFGNKYQVSKCLGVGTVAETYLAKADDGKEVCIKMLKKGISADKIQKDKQAFIDIINATNRTQDEKNYLIRNLESIAESVLKEVDFNNEMQAAGKLAQYTKAANVVHPITVKDGLYVMEKANGISLDSLTKLNDLMVQKKVLVSHGANTDEIDKKIEAIVKKTPAFKDIEISKADADYMLEEYMKILTEQFSKTNPEGKTIHGDIHPGNVFIDMDRLKKRQGKIFTLIDTGNTIDQSMEQALRFMNLTRYVKECDVPNLTKYVLDGAKLPEGMTMKQAEEKVSGEFRRIFFDTKTELPSMDNDEFEGIANNILKKLGIVPSDTQGALTKAKQSADNSFTDLNKMFYEKILSKLFESDRELTKKDVITNGAVFLADRKKNKMKFNSMKTKQEKLNLSHLPLSERVKYRKGSGLKKNSEEYLTFYLKQYKKI